MYQQVFYDAVWSVGEQRRRTALFLTEASWGRRRAFDGI
jgi:hypothetical protein